MRAIPTFNGPDVDITFLFTTPINAFGFYLTGAETAAQGTFSLIFNDGSARTLAISENAVAGTEFFGFTHSGAAISSVTVHEAGPFTGTRDVFGIDDVRFAAAPRAASERQL